MATTTMSTSRTTGEIARDRRKRTSSSSPLHVGVGDDDDDRRRRRVSRAHPRWRRSAAPSLDPSLDAITFMQIEVDHIIGKAHATLVPKAPSPVPVLRIFGVTRAGHSVCAHVHGFEPYFWLASYPTEGPYQDLGKLRILSFDIECAGREGKFPEPEHDRVIQIANMVTEQGDSNPVIKNVLTLGSCAPIADAEVLTFDDEVQLLRACSKAYGTRESKAYTIIGRVPLDLMQAIQRDHKLSSYSLNAVSAHFLGDRKEDVHHSAITKLQEGDEHTRRRLAVYCLKDAYLPQRLLDKLLIVYNYIEMARVTGVPLAYLLSRGQSIKVYSQLLRKARGRALLLPDMKKQKPRQSDTDAPVNLSVFRVRALPSFVFDALAEISASTTAFGREMIDRTRGLVEERYTTAHGYANNAEVIYGDTDSVMVNFQHEDVGEAMRLGAEAAEWITKTFLHPIRLEFEKVYWPYLLISKKRYAGVLWTDPKRYDKLDTKGIETVRRDNCQLVKEMVTTVLERIMLRRDTRSAVEFVKTTIADLLMNRVDISSLVITKGLTREPESYTVRSTHTELVIKMRKRDPVTSPKVGDRVPYVIVQAAKGAKAFEKAEDPVWRRQNDTGTEQGGHYALHPSLRDVRRLQNAVVPAVENALRTLRIAKSAVELSNAYTQLARFDW
ncbi:DNA polymerase delta catalytic subunit [Cymbomonas tetramitiformis]|uniref:DNA polymerase n=1 Tax=Cymbomonas tetramitiformis TaxID=36881 RepID=A0AAE0G9Y1_9CHLO|nr:DNA polymerase delta catalytic subunit [Cymbomonas tetramitiformis]